MRLKVMKALGVGLWLAWSATHSEAGIQEVLAKFHDSGSTHVLIAAHRGGYLSDIGDALPENSIACMTRTISVGAEILEVDVRMTSDGHLVIMHDDSVNRTTNGTGSVSSLTLTQIKNLRLKDPGGVITDQQVPELSEVMLLAKGKVIVNLDKVSVTNTTMMTAIMQVLRTTGTVDHALFKGTDSSAAVITALGQYPEPLQYMPVMENKASQDVISMLQALHPPAIELIFSSDTTTMLAPEVIAKAQETGTRIWVNSLWASLNGGHYDAQAIGGNPDGSWGWIVNKGAKIIQTDYPKRLAEYLWLRGNRDEEPPLRAYSIDYDFSDGTFQSWVNVRTSTAGAMKFVVDADTYGDRVPAFSEVYKVIHSPFLDGRDTYHQTLVLRSPEFKLRGLKPEHAIAFSLLGGVGGAAAAPASESMLPIVASPGGFMGVALRRKSDGAYLLSARRTATGQGANWQRLGWNAQQISSAVQNDAETEAYTLDLIDAYGAQNSGGTVSWGWIGLDAVSIPWTGNGDPKLPQVKAFNVNEMSLEWNSYPGYSYRVYRSGDLSPGSWSLISGVVPATPPMNRYLTQENSVSGGKAFFRVVGTYGSN